MKNVKAETCHLISDKMSPGTSVMLSKRWDALCSCCAPVCTRLIYLHGELCSRWAVHEPLVLQGPFHPPPFSPFASYSFCWVDQDTEQLPSVWVLLSALGLSFRLLGGTIWIKMCQVGKILNEGWGRSHIELKDKRALQFLCLLCVTAHNCGLWDPFFNWISSHTPRLQVYSTSSLLNWVKHLSTWSGSVMLKALVPKIQKAQSLPTGQTNQVQYIWAMEHCSIVKNTWVIYWIKEARYESCRQN